MICSSVNLLFLTSAILLVGGLLLLQVGTAGGVQVSHGLTVDAPEQVLHEWTTHVFARLHDNAHEYT